MHVYAGVCLPYTAMTTTFNCLSFVAHAEVPVATVREALNAGHGEGFLSWMWTQRVSHPQRGPSASQPMLHLRPAPTACNSP